jgi:hypothetical protein
MTAAIRCGTMRLPPEPATHSIEKSVPVGIRHGDALLKPRGELRDAEARR